MLNCSVIKKINRCRGSAWRRTLQVANLSLAFSTVAPNGLGSDYEQTVHDYFAACRPRIWRLQEGWFFPKTEAEPDPKPVGHGNPGGDCDTDTRSDPKADRPNLAGGCFWL